MKCTCFINLFQILLKNFFQIFCKVLILLDFCSVYLLPVYDFWGSVALDVEAVCQNIAVLPSQRQIRTGYFPLIQPFRWIAPSSHFNPRPNCEIYILDLIHPQDGCCFKFWTQGILAPVVTSSCSPSMVFLRPFQKVLGNRRIFHNDLIPCPS